MRQPIRIQHEFVENIPADVAEGVLYVSVTYATVVHKCCCGCGHEVVTPLTPSDWQLIFDGETVSLHPSIGNWSLECRSHYWLKRNQVTWAGEWTEEQIYRARAADRRNKASRFAARAQDGPGGPSGDLMHRHGRTRISIWSRLYRWLLGE